jgi:hypothetical protein
VGVSGLGPVEQGGHALGQGGRFLELLAPVVVKDLDADLAAILVGAQSRLAIQLQPAPHSLLARLAGQPSKGGHVLVEAAQQRVRVGLPPERYERENRLQAPCRSGDQRRTDKWPGIGWPVNKDIHGRYGRTSAVKARPSGYRIAVVLFLAHVCSHCLARCGNLGGGSKVVGLALRPDHPLVPAYQLRSLGHPSSFRATRYRGHERSDVL